MRRVTLAAVVLTVLAIGRPAVACLWDYDTLRDEKRGLPGVAEVLAGQWERHSRFFYEHRVAAMTAKLAVHPDDWDAMDNLAVAHAKLDDVDAAVAVMLDKERRHPGQYTTASNLGTFYMFKVDLPAAVVQLKRALAINPNAHFGREEYQLRLAEYLLQAKAAPFINAADFLHVGLTAKQWDTFVARSTTRPAGVEASLVADAEDFRTPGRRSLGYMDGIKPNVFDGVVGMVRFGTNKSPELYYALGDLLAADNRKALAYRAYQRALEAGHPRPDAVRKAMGQVKEMVVARTSFDPAVIADERAAADKWVADYQRFEDDLVRAGKDTDGEASYAPFYATHPRTLAARDFFWADYWAVHSIEFFTGGVCVGVPVAGVGLLVLRWWWRRRRARHAAAVGRDVGPPGVTAIARQ